MQFFTTAACACKCLTYNWLNPIEYHCKYKLEASNGNLWRLLVDSNWWEFVKIRVQLVKYTCISLSNWPQLSLQTNHMSLSTAVKRDPRFVLYSLAIISYNLASGSVNLCVQEEIMKDSVSKHKGNMDCKKMCTKCKGVEKRAPILVNVLTWFKLTACWTFNKGFFTFSTFFNWNHQICDRTFDLFLNRCPQIFVSSLHIFFICLL